MKTYPSIIGPTRLAPHLPCVAFYKYDGSNLRFEWNPKTGWAKYGTRWRLFDHTDTDFGCAVEIFHRQYANDIEHIFRKNKDYHGIQRATVYCEFYGPSSIGGWHDPNEAKQLMLLDVDVYKRGLIAPREFIKNFSHLESARIIYEGNFGKQLVEDVRNDKYPVKEGIVAKGWHKNKQWMVKVKTKSWLIEIREKSKNNPALRQVLEDNIREQDER